MDHWRVKVIEVFPEQERGFSNAADIYELFWYYMLNTWETAALNDNLQLAERVMYLVEWGLADLDYHVRNATSVSFLEHIPDEPLRLQFAERVMPEHLYKKAIELSARLLESDEAWRPHLEESVNRYNGLHKTRVVIDWP